MPDEPTPSAQQPTPAPQQVNVTATLRDDIGEIGGAIIRKASPVAISAMAILITLIGCSGVFLYFNKETIIRLYEVANEVPHLHEAHDRCKEELQTLKLRVDANADEIRELKDRLHIARK